VEFFYHITHSRSTEFLLPSSRADAWELHPYCWARYKDPMKIALSKGSSVVRVFPSPSHLRTAANRYASVAHQVMESIKISGVSGRAVESESESESWSRSRSRSRRVVESESEAILGGVGVGKNVPIPTPTSV
jgi:hypothetical protein